MKQTLDFPGLSMRAIAKKAQCAAREARKAGLAPSDARITVYRALGLFGPHPMADGGMAVKLARGYVDGRWPNSRRGLWFKLADRAAVFRRAGWKWDARAELAVAATTLSPRLPD